jgi:hypothetical protein
MTYDHREATTSEAEAYRAGQAALQERVNLALTHLRAELDRGGMRDTTRVRAAYRLLGGVGAAEAAEPVQPPQETPAEASERKQAEYARQRSLYGASVIAQYNAAAMRVVA